MRHRWSLAAICSSPLLQHLPPLAARPDIPATREREDDSPRDGIGCRVDLLWGMTWALATIAALLLAYAGSVRTPCAAPNVSGAMFFTTTGVLVGPVLGLIDVHVHREQIKLLAEITLTLVLFADASNCIALRPAAWEFAVPLRLLAIGLPLTIAAGMLTGAALIPGISLTEALVLAVVLAWYRCSARPGGRHRQADPVTHPSRTQRGERSQRWTVRAAVLHRDRNRPSRLRHSV